MAVDVKKRKKQRRRLLLAGALVCVFVVACVGISLFDGWDALYASVGLREQAPSSALSSELTVHLLDVGNADCVLVQNGEHAMLIDAGEQKSGGEIVDYLKRQGIEKLDYLIATHPHADHIGGMAEVVREVEVGVLLTTRLPDSEVPTTAVYERLLLALDERQVPLREIEGTEEFALGDALLAVWAPAGSYDDLNSYSLISRVSFGSKRFLFMGDAEADEEAELLGSGFAVGANVLKVGHHGSKTSTSDSFLQQVNPSVALIPSGRDNSYGHPSEETLEKLARAGVEVYRSDLCGDIVVTTDGASLSVTTEIPPEGVVAA